MQYKSRSWGEGGKFSLSCVKTILHFYKALTYCGCYFGNCVFCVGSACFFQTVTIAVTIIYTPHATIL